MKKLRFLRHPTLAVLAGLIGIYVAFAVIFYQYILQRRPPEVEITANVLAIITTLVASGLYFLFPTPRNLRPLLLVVGVAALGADLLINRDVGNGVVVAIIHPTPQCLENLKRGLDALKFCYPSSSPGKEASEYVSTILPSFVASISTIVLAEIGRRVYRLAVLFFGSLFPLAPSVANTSEHKLPDSKWFDPAWKNRDYHAMISKVSTFVSVEIFFRGGLKAARPVGMVRIGGVPDGTGFLTPGNILFTNNHVIDSKEKARIATVLFGYEEGSKPGEYLEYKLNPDTFFETGNNGAEGDWTAISVEGDPESTFGAIPLDPSATSVPDTYEWVNIIQHPLGMKKQVSCSGNIICWRGDDTNGEGNLVASNDPSLVQYLTDAAKGSSGSPVFDRSWRLVAIHHASFNEKILLQALTPGGPVETLTRNEGIAIRHILKSYRKPPPPLPTLPLNAPTHQAPPVGGAEASLDEDKSG